MAVLINTWLLVVLAASHIAKGAFPPPCDSDIYCQGDLLHTVQMAKLHNDSKYFVDMGMRFDPEEVKANFAELMQKTKNKPTPEEVREFVADNFHAPGCEFVTWNPTDWVENPAFLSRIQDRRLRDWIRKLHGFWKELGRQVAGEVYLHPDRYSLSFVPNPTIVPGGRFREYYYWDSYWVITGLLLSEMDQTVLGMLQNFLAMIKKFGFVPNGGRVYYQRRSQPPFLIPMVKLYLDATNDTEFIMSNIEFLEREYAFWRANRTIQVQKDGRNYTMYRYNVEVGQPRPESYREDLALASATEGGASSPDAEQLYAEIKTGAESGWDFSSRWFIPHDGGLKDTKIRSIVPVDLNSLMYWNAALLAEFFQRLGNTSQAERYQYHADEQKRNIEAVLWDDSAGSWFDWDTINSRPIGEFYAANIFPVWVNASTDEQNEKFLQYMQQNNVTNFTSGIPTSLERSGQQWDFPNGWPPLQLVTVEALNNMATPEARRLAFELAQKWIDTNYLCYREAEPNAMFEKYDVTQMGLPGGGGEYDVQLGFGWSNGVAMALADLYGDRLRAPSAASLGRAAPVLLLLVALLPLLFTTLLAAQ